MNVTREAVERIVNECIEELFTKDWCLLENDASERAITHKLAEYLQQRIPYLHVDCEYNRNATKGKGEPKKVSVLPSKTREKLRAALDRDTQDDVPPNLDDALTEISTYPDIIVHRRMTNAENLLVVEVKKSNSQVDREHDYIKLEAFTENTEQNSYHFSYGVFILLETECEQPTEPKLIWFADGKQQRQKKK